MREPRVFSIPTGTPFLPTLAEALLDGTLLGGRGGPTGLGEATIYLPTRRAGRALAALLSERSGRGPVLLPRIVPLGDAAEDDGAIAPASDAQPAVSPLVRRLVLSRLVQAWLGRIRPGGPGSAGEAIALADDLAGLMDSLETEDVPWDDLAGAVEREHSRHFAQTLDFVRIAHESWPAILAELEASDPVRTRNAALRAAARALGTEPGTGPVVAAGSTGSVPATAALLAAIARAPAGAVVLPGLDADLDSAAWRAIGADPALAFGSRPALWGHPQCMLARLLGTIGIERPAVRTLGPVPAIASPAAQRRRVLSEAMRPAETTQDWAAMPTFERLALVRAGLEGMALVEAADEREEALAIALALRETLASPGRTAALVTPDRALARRVAIELGRWGVRIADSAPVALADTAAGRLARLAAEAVASRFAPLSVLALLAHPDTTLGLERATCVVAAAALEIAVLRGPPPGPGLAGIASALAVRRRDRGGRDPLPRQNLSDRAWDAAADLLARLERAFAAFGDAAPQGSPQVPLAAFVLPHAAAAAALVSGPSDEDRPDRVALLALFDEMAALPSAAVGLVGRLADYPGFFAALARERSLPPDLAGTHRRVRILGLLEARLLHVDRIVLGGLDETVWPPSPESDSFLNRPMRAKLGLSPAERRIGQTAHDFVQALGTPDAILTRARKRDGKPTVPSRFLERLRSFAGRPDWAGVQARGREYLRLAAVLDAPRPVAPIARPEPRPGPERFPDGLSVTEVETLVRDPYAIFARHVLRLTALEPVGQDPTVAERGTLLHGVLAQFAETYPDALPPDPEAALVQIGLDAFGPLAAAFPELHALWWPDLLRIVPRYLDWEAERRLRCPERRVEIRGRLEMEVGPRSFTLRAKADRIETGPDEAAIVDFKSGRVPTAKEVAVGFSPQLTLEAAILRAGGFGIDAPTGGELALRYVKLGGAARLAETCFSPPNGDKRSVDDVVDAHLAGLRELVRRYGLEGDGYRSRPYPQYGLRYSAYDHLARVREWAAAAEPEEAA